MVAVIDLVGRRFGRLLVIARAQNGAGGKARFTCSCDCGGTAVVQGNDLRSSHTKSCGCWRVEFPSIEFATHRTTGSAEYRSWSHMKTRCFNPRSKFYERYGGRGISVCPEWAASFESFYRDMGPRPTPQHSIDRIDNDGNYEPGNVRWATPIEQSSNRTTVRLVTFEGVTDSIAGWSRRTGIPYIKLRRRILSGLSLERALDAEEAATRAKPGYA